MTRPTNIMFTICDVADSESLRSTDSQRLRDIAPIVADFIAVARMVVNSDRVNRWGGSCAPIVEAAHRALARIERAE